MSEAARETRPSEARDLGEFVGGLRSGMRENFPEVPEDPVESFVVENRQSMERVARAIGALAAGRLDEVLGAAQALTEFDRGMLRGFALNIGAGPASASPPAKGGGGMMIHVELQRVRMTDLKGGAKTWAWCALPRR